MKKVSKAWRIAKKLAVYGVNIIPVPAQEKGCKLANWPELATTDIDQIQQWIDRDPDGNYGCVCSPSTIVVLDADDPGLSSYIERSTGQTFPDTLTIKTSHGYHYYFFQTDKTRAVGNRKVPGMFDLQSDRKYVVGPGSIHPSGAAYGITNDTDPVPMPEWLADYLDRWSAPKPKSERAGEPELEEEFDPDEWYVFNDISGHEDGEWFITDECPVAGYRHEQSWRTGFFYDGNTWGFNCFASGCEGSGMSIGQVVAHVNKQRREAGLPVWKEPIWVEDESDLHGVENLDDFEDGLPVDNPGTVMGEDGVVRLKPTSERLVKADPEHEQEEPGPEEDEPEEQSSADHTLRIMARHDNGILVVRRASDIQMAELQWLWPQRIPKGKVTFYTGKPDCGKTLALIDLVARVSTGADFADGSRNEHGPAKVLFASSEDDPADTLVPRLTAAGANLDNVYLFYGTVLKVKGKDKKATNRRRTLNLKDDAKLLTTMLEENPDIRMLALDPIVSFFGDIDQNKDKEVRPVMDRLTATCNKSGVTVVGLIHSNKRSDVDAIHKVSGAGSLAAAVRAVWGFSRDTDDKSQYHMAHVKGNLGKDKSGLHYSIQEALVDIQGKSVGVPRIEWGERFDGDADDLMTKAKENRDSRDTKLLAAKMLLRAQKYPVKATKVYELAEAEGIKSTTIKDAKRALQKEGLELVAQKDGGAWWWYDAKDLLQRSIEEIHMGHLNIPESVF